MRFSMLVILGLALNPVSNTDLTCVGSDAPSDVDDIMCLKRLGFNVLLDESSKGHRVVEISNWNTTAPVAEISKAALQAILRCTNLRRFDLSSCRVQCKDMRQLKTLERLEKLRVADCDLDDDCLTEIGAITSIRNLDLSHNPRITGAGLTQLYDLPLEALHLVSNRIDDRGVETLVKLTRLKFLDLQDTKVTTKSCENLSTLAHLEVLSLAGISMNKEGLNHLAKIKTLKTLLLDHSGLDDDGLRILSSVSDLEKLAAADCRVSGKGLRHLPKNLRVLDLSRNPLETGFSDLARLKHIEFLNLDETPIRDQDVEFLRELRELKSLHLTDTRLTSAALKDTLAGGKVEFLVISLPDVDEGSLQPMIDLPTLKVVHIVNCKIRASELKRLQRDRRDLSVVVPGCTLR